MRIIFCLWFLIIFSIPCQTILATELDIPNFKHLTTRDGLGDNGVICVLQDQKGFMWFGTLNGLYKYDGSQLSLVKKNFFQPKGWGNIVEQIVEDRIHHKLWILVNNKVFSLDLRTEKIEEKISLDREINTISIDQLGNLWIAVDKEGLYIYRESKLELFQSIPQNYCRSVIAIQNIKIDQLAFLDREKGVFIYDSSSKKTHCYSTKISNVINFYFDRIGRLWLGTWDGVYLWNETSSSFEKFKLMKDSFQNNKILPYFAVNCITEDSDGNILFGTDTGIFILKKTGKIVNYRSDYHENTSLSCNFICDLYFDREETLWVGTYSGGINYLSKTNRNFTKFQFINEQMEGHSISDFAEDIYGNIWIATEDAGVTVYQPFSQKIRNYNPLIREVNFINAVGIHCLACSGNWLYIGMVNSGVFIYHQNNHKVIHLSRNLKSNRKLVSNTVNAFCIMPNEELAIGTLQGLDFYNKNKDRVYHVEDLPKKCVNSILWDKNGFLWVCGKDMGIYYRDSNGIWKNFDKSFHQLPTHEIYTMAQKDDFLYFGTKNYGILSYNIVTGKMESILEEILESDIVYKIIPYNNSLWITTSCGLFNYDLKHKTSKHYTENEGLNSNQFNINSGILTSDSTILIGTIYGLNGFKPNDIYYNKKAPTTVFTELTINNEKIIPNDNHALLDMTMPYTKRVILNYNENNLSLAYASLSYSGDFEKKYRYKFLTNNSKWLYTSSDRLVFNQLPPGKYQLLVSSCNSDGVWDQEGAGLEINVLLPWWRSWYMYVMYLFLFLGIVTLLYYRFKKIQLHKMELLRIKKKEELYRMKIDFFTNVVHDIRTPLSLIITPLQLLSKRKDTQTFNKELSLIYRNSKRLLNNVNQLLDFRKLDNNFIIKPQCTYFDVVIELEKIIEDFQLFTINNGLILNFDKKGIGNTRILNTDVTMFNKIFTNLLSNAFKYASSKVNVIITNEDGYCKICIQDDGNGISAEDQKHLFEPFYQVSDCQPKDNIGSGIGLYIVKELLNNLRGTICIDSAKGHGCNISVKFNDKLTNVSEHEIKNECIVNEEVIPIDSSSKPNLWNIAVIEDNEDMRCLIVSILRPYYKVFEYSNAKALLDDIENTELNLIVSDIMMPEMDGLELCCKIKGNINTCHIPIILLTAKILEIDEIEGFRQGADAYIRKPFSADLLLIRVNGLIRNRERIAEKYRNDPNMEMKDTINEEANKNFIAHLDSILVENLRNPDLSPQFVASEFCMCRTLFFSKMKSVTGMTFSEYLKIFRLKFSIELLKKRKYTMVEIADTVGFSSQSYFTQCFKKQFHVTPSEYMHHFDENDFFVNDINSRNEL